MPWYTTHLPDDSEAWNAHKQKARENNEALLKLIGKTSSGCAEPSIDFVKYLRARFEAQIRRPPLSHRECNEIDRQYWRFVKSRND